MAVGVADMENAALPQDTPLPLADDTDIGSEMYYLDAKGNVTFGRIGRDEDGVGSEQRKYERQGWKSLPEYGSFKIRPYHVDRPFEVFFLRGGAKDMPVRQIIDQGFHFRPPLMPRCGVSAGEGGHVKGSRRNMKVVVHTAECWAGAKPVQFPQLDGQDIAGPFECRFCFEEDGESRMFPHRRGLEQHQSVMHKEVVGSDRLGSQLIQGLSGHTGPSAADLDLRGEFLKLQEKLEAIESGGASAPVAVAGEFVPAATPYVCGLCGEAQKNTFDLNKHISAHKQEPVAASAAA